MSSPLAFALVPAFLAGFAWASAVSPVRAAPPVREASLAAAHVAALQHHATSAVHHALATDNPHAVRLVDAELLGRRLTLNFSRELIDLDPGSVAFEQFSRRLHRAAAEELRADLADFEVHTLIDGAPLHEVLDAVDRRALVLPPTVPADALPPPRSALATRRIVVSPGHGYYLNPANAWVLQRGYWQGIVEDFVNHDMVTLLRNELVAAGAEVLSTRNLDRAAGVGESGFPRWQEAARYHVKALGADPSIWNESGFTHLDQDIRCRPRYANSVNGDILVSLHNNGAAGTGTETLYDTNNGFGPESKRLADAVHGRVIATLRREYNATWADRRVQGFNGSYGENRLATRPAILIEVAFMDRPTPDNAALQDAAFHRLVARAIREGVEEYFNAPGVAPTAPTGLIATAGATAITLAWTDLSANESGFRIERRTGPTATWEALATIGANLTTYADTRVAAGTTFVYRVVAYNGAGNSAQYSNEATAGPAAPPGAPAPARAGAWLANISLRTTLAVGQTVTVGLVVAGGTRDVLVRGAGPTLGALGVTGVMADPRLELYRGASIATANNDWPASLAPTMAALGAFPFSAASRDAALLQPLEGPHTIVAAGTAAGAILVEGYDAGAGGTGRLTNLSARNRVGTGGDILIAGFFLAGTGTKQLLIRAVGPTLASLGVVGALGDPRLEVYDAVGVKIAENDNWEAVHAPTFASVAAFALPPGSRDAALVLTLNAGRGYTAQVSGVGNIVGEALVEVYELP